MGCRLLPLILILCLLPWMALADGTRDDPNAPCDPEQPVCLLDTGIAPVVSLLWQELPPPRRIPPIPRWVGHLPSRWRDMFVRWHRALFQHPTSVVVRDRVTLVAQNETREPVRARITLQPWGLRRETLLPEFDIVLDPKQKQQLPVDLASLGFDLSRANSLVGVRAVVQSHGQTGRSSTPSERLDQNFSPMLYLQLRDSRSRTLRAFGEDQLDTFVNEPAQSGSGNPFCTFTIPEPEEELELAIDPGPGDPDPAQDFSVDPPSGVGEIKFCFALPVDTKDSGIGEDWASNPTTNFPASHAQVKIATLPPGVQTVVDDEFLDVDGCVTFEHISDPGYTVKLTGRARVPRTDNPVQSNMLTIQTVQLGPPLQLGIPAWYWCSDEDLEVGDTKWFYANPNRRTNLLGMSIWSLRRFSDGVADQNIFVQDRPCSSNPTNSCTTATGSATVQIHPDHNQYRYAVSHEMGHRILWSFLDGNHPLPCGAYAVDAGGPACEWELSHALHSKEFAVAAIGEGWAQFYATAVYNDLSDTDGWFHYYKDDYKDGAVKVVDMEGELVGGSTAYLDTICEAPHDGFGVELDWARQFWDYLSDPGLKPTRLQLLQQIKMAWESDWNLGNQTESMNDAAISLAGGVYAERWLDAAEHNGVDPSFADDCFWSVACSMVSCSTACTADDCECSACDP